jgi:serine phosphatase RsbU (regulator of sigma subunit)
VDHDGLVTIANAGHLAPYLDGTEPLLESGLPLGLSPELDWPETELRLLPGSMLTLVSDGVVEAANSTGELFGFDRTRDISTKNANEIAEAARAWGQNDDITVVTVRCTNQPG